MSEFVVYIYQYILQQSAAIMRLQRKTRHQFVSGVCNFLDSVSPQQEFEAMGRPVLQLSFICKQRKMHP